MNTNKISKQRVVACCFVQFIGTSVMTNGTNRWPFFLMITWILSYFCRDCDGDNFVSKWKEKKYFEQGFPLVTKEVYQQLLHEDFMFVPNYTVLENGCSDEENVHVLVKDVGSTLFHLYGHHHPDYPNYKITISYHTTEMHKCTDAKSCEKLLVCEAATIQFNDEEKSDQKDVVYISWQRSTKISTLSILAQYKNKITKCRDFSDPFEIKKFILYSIQRQLVSSTRVSFLVEQNVNNSRKTVGPFSLTENELVHVQVLQCLDCKMTIKLECKNKEINNVTILAKNGTKVVNFQQLLLHDSWYYGWRGHDLDNLSKKNQTECYLKIDLNTYNHSSTKVETFWAFGYGTANIKKQNIILTESALRSTDSFETKTEEQTSKKQQSTAIEPSIHTLPCPPNSGKAYSRWCIIVYIISGIYFCFKYKLS